MRGALEPSETRALLAAVRSIRQRLGDDGLARGGSFIEHMRAFVRLVVTSETGKPGDESPYWTIVGQGSPGFSGDDVMLQRAFTGFLAMENIPTWMSGYVWDSIQSERWLPLIDEEALGWEPSLRPGPVHGGAATPFHEIVVTPTSTDDDVRWAYREICVQRSSDPRAFKEHPWSFPQVDDDSDRAGVFRALGRVRAKHPNETRAARLAWYVHIELCATCGPASRAHSKFRRPKPGCSGIKHETIRAWFREEPFASLLRGRCMTPAEVASWHPRAHKAAELGPRKARKAPTST